MRFAVETMQKVNYEPFGKYHVKLPKCEAASELQLSSVHAGCIGSTQILVDSLTVCPEHTQKSVSYVCIRMQASNSQVGARTSLLHSICRCH